MKVARVSKKKKLENLDEARADEHQRLISLLTDADLYTPSLDPLIENYLDAFVIYKTMYESWRDEGFPPTKLHENKAGAVNEMKHPLAQHVETWNEKKNKILKALGMTNEGKSAKKPQNNASETDNKPPQDELAAHRAKWRGTK